MWRWGEVTVEVWEKGWAGEGWARQATCEVKFTFPPPSCAQVSPRSEGR